MISQKKDSPSTKLLLSQKFVWARTRGSASLRNNAPPFSSSFVTTKQNHRMLSHPVLCFVGERGLEPPCLATPAPKAGASTNFATRPKQSLVHPV